jgi:hypothetical protein
MKTLGYILFLVIMAWVILPNKKDLKQKLDDAERLIEIKDSLYQVREAFVIDSIQTVERSAKNIVQSSLKTLDSTISNIAKNERYLKYNK